MLGALKRVGFRGGVVRERYVLLELLSPGEAVFVARLATFQAREASATDFRPDRLGRIGLIESGQPPIDGCYE